MILKSDLGKRVSCDICDIKEKAAEKSAAFYVHFSIAFFA